MMITLFVALMVVLLVDQKAALWVVHWDNRWADQTALHSADLMVVLKGLQKAVLKAGQRV